MLWLSDVRVSDEGLTWLAPAIRSGAPRLRHLTLSHNTISSLAPLAVAMTDGLTDLRELDVGFNHICDLEGLESALVDGAAPLLRWLELSHNRLDEGAALALARAIAAGALPHIEVLALEGNSLASAEALAQLEAALYHARCLTDDLRDDLRLGGPCTASAEPLPDRNR